MKAIVAERGQVTIPKVLRKKLGIKAGTILDLSIQKTKLIAIKLNAKDPVSAVFGCLKQQKTTDKIMESLRGTVEKSTR